MPLDVGRVTHLLEQMHRSEDDAGDPIDDGYVLVSDGARGFTWELYGGGVTTHWEPVIFDNAGTPEIVYFQDSGGVWDIVMHEVSN